MEDKLFWANAEDALRYASRAVWFDPPYARLIEVQLNPAELSLSEFMADEMPAVAIERESLPVPLDAILQLKITKLDSE